MSRYRDDRDDDYYGGRGRGPARGNYEDDRYGSRREDYSRRGGAVGGRDVSEEAERIMRRADRPYGGRDFDDYGRGSYGGGGRGDFYRDDYSHGGPGRRPRRGDDDERDDERGRSLFEEGRDYLQRRFGRGRERGASRSHVRCRDIMTRDVTVATRTTTLQEVAVMMRDEDTGVIPVVEHPESVTNLAESRSDINRVQPNVVGGGKLIGLITDRDIVVRAIAEGKDPRVTRAEEIMTSEVHTARPNDRVVDAIRKMGDKQVRRIPVVDRDNALRGIISMADVALETEDDRELADALEEISSGSSFWSKVFG